MSEIYHSPSTARSWWRLQDTPRDSKGPMAQGLLYCHFPPDYKPGSPRSGLAQNATSKYHTNPCKYGPGKYQIWAYIGSTAIHYEPHNPVQKCEISSLHGPTANLLSLSPSVASQPKAEPESLGKLRELAPIRTRRARTLLRETNVILVMKILTLRRK